VKHPPAFFIQKGKQLMIGLIENPPTKRRAKLCLHCGGSLPNFKITNRHQ
jgi:hypothetical protein